MAHAAEERKPEKIQIGKSQFWLFTYSIGFFRANSSQIVGPRDFYEVKLPFKSSSFSKNYGRTSRLSSFYYISNHENFIPKYLEKAFNRSRPNFTNIGAGIEEQAPLSNYEKKRLSVQRNRAASEMESDVISLLLQLRCQHNIAHNKFPSFFLLNLWQLFFLIFVTVSLLMEKY